MQNKSDPEILVKLSLGQAEGIVRHVVGSGGPGVSLVRVLLALGGLDRVEMGDLERDPHFHAPKLAQVLVISLMALSPFRDCEARRVTDLAAELGMSASTLVRYLKTWVALGVLEQDQRNRRYRLALCWRNELAASSRPPTPATDPT
jgi:hypothetical protein